jgi:dimethylhistidine N-methyltransferase
MDSAKSFNFHFDVILDHRLEVLRDSDNESYDHFSRDVTVGLGAKKKFLPPKYFYDQIGSDLFVKITQTDEYYPTRTELSILKNFSSQIAERCSHINTLVELGSGSSEKTNTLLEKFHQNGHSLKYVPIDISDIAIDGSVQLLKKYDRLSVTGIISDYKKSLAFLSQIETGPKLIVFLGSSIGNFNPNEIEDFLIMIRKSLNAEDFIMIGFDLVKDRDVLHAAYNDSQGITRDFNLNVLERINRELDGDFNLSKFEHRAQYNEANSRMEMYLVSKEEQTVTIGALNKKISFAADETIHTENSHKFTPEMIQSYTMNTGLEYVESWTDSQEYFSLCLFKLAV